MVKKILLVEDEAILALSEERMLTKHGFEVTKAYNGESAVEIVDTDPDISLVLMDIDLGEGMDGTEAAADILERHDLPIAFLSSHTEPEIVEKTEGITSYGYIVKNSGETVLLASIRMAFRLYDAHIELKEQKEQLRTTVVQVEQTEEELREREEMFRNLMENSIDAVYLLDKEGRLLDVNKRACEMIGYAREELLKMSVADIDTNYPSDGFSRFWKTQPKGTSVLFETVHRHKNGTHIPVEVNGIFFEVGKQNYLFGVARDITERKEREARIAKSERNLRITLNSIGDAVVSTDSHGHVVRMNPVAENLCGWTENDALGKPLEDVFHIVNADTRAKADNPAETVMATGKIAGLANHTVLISKDGSEYQIADSAAPITDEEGNSTGVVLVFRDVTDRYEKDRLLTESEERLRTFLAHSPLLMSEIDPLGRYLRVNPALADVLDASPSEVAGKTFDEVLPPDLAASFNSRIARVRETLEPLHIEDEVDTGDASRLYITTLFPLFDGEGNLRSIGAIAHDISKLKDAQKQLQLERRRLAEIIEATDLGTWEWNVQTGEATFNERWAGIVGYTPEEIAPISIEVWKRFAHPDDLEKSEKLLEEHFRGETSSYQCEARMKHRDGSWVWVLDTGRVISWTEDGKPLIMRGTHQDITAPKQIETARKHLASAARDLNAYTTDTVDYAQIAENMRELSGAKYAALNVYDAAGHQYVTTAVAGTPKHIEHAERLLGFSIVGKKWDRDPVREERIADSKTTFFHSLGELADSFLSRHLTNSIARMLNIGGAVIVKTSKGERILGGFTLLFEDARELKNKAPVELYADMVGMLLYRLETERRNAELVAEKENLLKEVQHRIKNTMNTMVGMLTLEADALQENPHAAAALNDARSRFQSMEVLYDQLYRTETHDRGSTRTYVEQLVDRAAELFPSGKNVYVHTDIEDFSLDARRLSNLGLVVNELVTNAMKHAYHDRTEGKLSIRLYRSNGRITLIVSDDGPGMPAAFLHADGSLHEPTGTSFGLSMVAALTEQLSATIRFHHDGGTRAVLEFEE